MITSIAHEQVLKPDAKVYIDANCSVKSLIETHDAIYKALEFSELLKDLVKPGLIGSIAKEPSYYVVSFFIQMFLSP